MNNSIVPLSGILADIDSLTLFSRAGKHPVIRSLGKLLRLLENREASTGNHGDSSGSRIILKAWARFAAALIEEGRNCSLYSTVAFLTLSDENPFTLAAEFGSLAALHPALTAAAANDLARLGRIAVLDTEALAAAAAALIQPACSAGAMETEGRSFASPLPRELKEETALVIFPPGSSWNTLMPAFGKYLSNRGAGELGLYPSFSWVHPGKLKPVSNPDPVRLSDLSLYSDQREVVVSNTLRFLEGKCTNNLLLYGDRGTGKSATVKAVCSEYADRGLRLIEIRKDYLDELPAVLASLGRRNRKFVIFIDDLSFETVDNLFTGLKALLEGGVETRPPNTVIYATSNRRHLVKERMADRPSSPVPSETAASAEVRAFDSMQEQLSLADRFGVTVIYTLPSQDEYLKIAEDIACRRGILSDAGDTPFAEREERLKLFRENAIRWERWFNGRSPRTAAQYVDWLAGGEGFPWD